MKAILQRVVSGSVSVGGNIVSEIKHGLVCLIGIGQDDTKDDAEYIARKILNLRLWKSDDGTKNWDRCLTQNNYEVLLVSQFTLFCTLKGNKPDFHLAMPPQDAKSFYNDFVESVKKSYVSDKVKDGQFGEMMIVDIKNDGPITITLDSKSR